MLHLQIPPNAARPIRLRCLLSDKCLVVRISNCSSDLCLRKTFLFRICQTLSFRRVKSSRINHTVQLRGNNFFGATQFRIRSVSYLNAILSNTYRTFFLNFPYLLEKIMISSQRGKCIFLHKLCKFCHKLFNCFYRMNLIGMIVLSFLGANQMKNFTDRVGYFRMP